MRLSILLFAVIVVLAVVVAREYLDHEAALVILAIITGAYVIIRGIHALGGRGGTVSIVDVFLLCYAVAFWAFLLHYWYEVTVGAAVLLAAGVLWFFLWLIMNSQLARSGIKGGYRRIFPGRSGA